MMNKIFLKNDQLISIFYMIPLSPYLNKNKQNISLTSILNKM